jgi:hypothetical protein
VRNDVAMTVLTPERLSQVIPPGTSQIQVDLRQMPTRVLSHVRIGRTFVFGLLEDNLSWCLIRLSAIRSVTFLLDQSLSESQVHWTTKTAGELVSNLELPARGIIQFREQPKRTQQIIVLGLARGFIATDCYRHQHIPLSAISYLELTGC